MTAVAELERIAANVVRPSGAFTVVIVEAGTTGERLPSGHFSGIGGTTAWGPAWFDGLRKSKPVHLFPTVKDARALAAILDGREPALRSSPHSVAAPPRSHAAAGPAERGEVPSVVPGTRAPRTPRSARLHDAVGTRAGSPASALSEASVAEAPAVTCAACGRDMADLPPSRTGQLRKTCGDACRKAYQRGHRAPVPGVVAPEAVAALSRLPRALYGFPHGDRTDPAGPGQLAIPLEQITD